MKRGLLLVMLLLTMAALAVAMGSKEAKEKKIHATDSTATRQGIAGKVEIWEGNFMPMVDPAKAKNQVKPGAGRRVRAYQPVKSSGGIATAHVDSIATAMVSETVCDSTGAFFLSVSAGTYSVYVEDGHGWYANGWNGDGIQGAVTVEPGKTANALIKITTKATF